MYISYRYFQNIKRADLSYDFKEHVSVCRTISKNVEMIVS